MKLGAWAERHRMMGHHLHPAPTKDNPNCGTAGAEVKHLAHPERIEQIRRKFAHLGKHPTTAREAQRRELQAHIAEIQAEQEEPNAALRKIDHSHVPPLRIAERYAGGIRRKRQVTATRSKGTASNF